MIWFVNMGAYSIQFRVEPLIIVYICDAKIIFYIF